jgi:hypothetical protein
MRRGEPDLREPSLVLCRPLNPQVLQKKPFDAPRIGRGTSRPQLTRKGLQVGWQASPIAGGGAAGHPKSREAG